ncbi:MAG: hypothetical protein P1U40_08255 [Coxiellaceae bacterium]|nr:hypothetical protein [Coxiellaceae bacterium]
MPRKLHDPSAQGVTDEDFDAFGQELDDLFDHSAGTAAAVASDDSDDNGWGQYQDIETGTAIDHAGSVVWSFPPGLAAAAPAPVPAAAPAPVPAAAPAPRQMYVRPVVNVPGIHSPFGALKTLWQLGVKYPEIQPGLVVGSRLAGSQVFSRPAPIASAGSAPAPVPVVATVEAPRPTNPAAEREARRRAALDRGNAEMAEYRARQGQPASAPALPAAAGTSPRVECAGSNRYTVFVRPLAAVAGAVGKKDSTDGRRDKPENPYKRQYRGQGRR